MTTIYAIDRCKVLSDKYGSPSIEDDEWLGHLNMASYEALNRLVPDSVGNVVNFELDQNVVENIRQLIYLVQVTPVLNVATIDSLNTAIRSGSGDNNATVFRLLNMAVDGYMARFVKHNDILKLARNVFKESTNQFPIYTITANGYRLYPVNRTQVIATVIKTPKQMDIGNSPDWSDYMMNQIILLAAKMAGVGIRDEELIVNLRNTGIQAAQ